MRPPALRLALDELVVDNFAGGGGASTGIRMALGRDPDLAINHDPEALALYRANHPGTRVLCEDVFNVAPRLVCGGRRVGLLWASPDCTHFSKARGGVPFRDPARARRRRGLAGVVLRWAAEVRPRVIIVENVEEFRGWGPLGEDGRPCPERRGQSFRRWCSRLQNLSYRVDLRELRACDFGAPTSRKRLFIIARCDGEAIAWPEPTHGPGRAAPFRTAAECIDWTLPCPSIFERSRPLAEATLRRIARGIRRYVIEAERPFLVPLTHHGDERVYSVDEPLRTVTGANRGEQAVVAPLIARLGQWNGNGAYVNDTGEPLTTVTTKAEHMLIAPTLIQTGWGERPGQEPRALDTHKPLGTIMAEGVKHAAVVAFLAKHYGGGPNGVQTPGSQLGLPIGTVLGTIMAEGVKHAAVVAFLAKHYGGGPNGVQTPGSQLGLPIGTVTAVDHHALVASSLVKLKAQLGLPLPTATTRDRFAVVTVAGVDYAIVDIGMRMLTPRELFLAQGFPPDYVIDPEVDGRRLSKTAQVHKCGNSVPPPFSAALVRAQFQRAEEAVAC